MFRNLSHAGISRSTTCTNVADSNLELQKGHINVNIKLIYSEARALVRGRTESHQKSTATAKL
jgi:transaldolase